MEAHVEVHFKYDSPVMGEAVEEVLWAKVVDAEAGVYELVSIPFYGLPLATADHFEAQYDEAGEELHYQNVVRNSGNSVAVVAVAEDNFEVEQLIEELAKLNCRSEALNAKYFAVEVPKTVFYGPVRDLLDKHEEQGSIEFAESRLSAKHQSDLRRHN